MYGTVAAKRNIQGQYGAVLVGHLMVVSLEEGWLRSSPHTLIASTLHCLQAGPCSIYATSHRVGPAFLLSSGDFISSLLAVLSIYTTIP
jgi:hypothetical protein